MKAFEGIRTIKPLVAGQVLSIFGDRLALVALIELVSQETQRFKTTYSIFELSKLTLAMTLPSFVLAPLIGTYVDRVSRKKTLVVSDLFRGVIIILIPSIHGLVPLWGLYLVVALVSLINLFFLPARCAIVPQLVEPSRIATANSVLTIGATFATIAGFAIGGVVTSFMGWQVALIVDGITFLVSAGFMMMLTPTFEVPEPQRWEKSLIILKESFAQIIRSKEASIAIVAPALVGAASTAAYMLGVPILQRSLEHATMWVGITIAFGAVGIVLGCYLVGSQAVGLNLTKTLTRCSIITTTLLSLLATTTNRFAIGVSVFLAGVSAGPVLVLSETSLQKQIELNRQATAFSIRDTLLKGSIVITVLVAPILSIWTSDRIALVVVVASIVAFLIAKARTSPS